MEAKKHINGTAMNGHTSNGIMLEKDKYMPVAIIGMACRFPGDATSPNSFWDMLATKRDVWREVPKDRFNIDAFYHPDPDRNGSVSVIPMCIFVIKSYIDNYSVQQPWGILPPTGYLSL